MRWLCILGQWYVDCVSWVWVGMLMLMFRLVDIISRILRFQPSRLFPQRLKTPQLEQRKLRPERTRMRKKRTRTSDNGCTSVIQRCGPSRGRKYPKPRRICAFMSDFMTSLRWTGDGIIYLSDVLWSRVFGLEESVCLCKCTTNIGLQCFFVCLNRAGCICCIRISLC
jgi:hypothetical protein